MKIIFGWIITAALACVVLSANAQTPEECSLIDSAVAALAPAGFGALGERTLPDGKKRAEEIGDAGGTRPYQECAATPPHQKPVRPRKLLIFTLNVGYGGHPSIAHANRAFTAMGQKTGAFTTEVSNDPQVFQRESLRNVDAVLFNNTVGNCFTNADLRKNLLDFVSGGGGLMGLHGSSVAFTRWPGAVEDWPEFGEMLGARGASHRESDERVWIRVEDPKHPLTSMFAKDGFEYRDEFFRFPTVYSRDRVRVLLSIDTQKTDQGPGGLPAHVKRPDNDYALAWVRNYGKGRVFYSTIAHNPRVFWDTKMLQFYLAAAQFALGDLPAPATPSGKMSHP